MPTKKSTPKKKTTKIAKATQKIAKKISRPDATKLLKQDHEKVKSLFEEADELSDRATAKRRAIFEEIRTELTVHAKIEEEIFYPAMQKSRDKEAKEQVLEAFEEHAIAKMLIKQLEESDAGDETFKAKLKVLKDVILHHAKEEEKEMFPEAKKILSSDQLEELGAQMENRKQQLLAMGPDAIEAKSESDEMAEENEEDLQRAAS
jgi:hemerythrin superfamily protein